jgi:hypothetical protein
VKRTIVGQIAYTFNAVAKNADFSQVPKIDTKKPDDKGRTNRSFRRFPKRAMVGFHFNIHLGTA